MRARKSAMSTQTAEVSRHNVLRTLQDRRIAVGFLWVSLFVLLAKGVGAAKEMAIAWRYGVSSTVDSYVLVFQAVTWPISIWFSVLCVALVPALTHLRASSSTSDVQVFRGELLAWNIALGGFLCMLMAGAGIVVSQSGWLSANGDLRAELEATARVLLLIVPIGTLCSYFSALLMSSGAHRNSLFEALPALGLLLLILAPTGWVPAPLLWGTVLGYTIQLAVLWHAVEASRDVPHMRFQFQSPAWRQLGWHIAVMLGTQTLLNTTVFIDQILAVQAGPGTVSSISYAARLVSLVLGLGAVAIGRATLNVFCEVRAANARQLHPIAFRWAWRAFWAGAAVTAILWSSGHWLVKLLFERGAFTAHDASVVTDLLRVLSLQIPFYFAGTVLMNYLASAAWHRKLLLAAIVALLCKLAFVATFTGRMSAQVIAASVGVFIFCWFATLLACSIHHSKEAAHD